MFNGRIYCITCLVNGKMYIGQTVQLLDNRWRRHVLSTQRGSDHKFHRAIRKYGEENFLVEEVLTVSAPTKEILKRKLDYVEMRLIKRFNTFRNGYNMTLGGEGQLGKVFSEESKRKMSEAAKKRCTPEFRKRKSVLMKNLRQDESFVQKQCEASRNALRNPELQKKMGLSRRGKPLSEEHKRKIGRAVTGERNGMYLRKFVYEK